MKVEAVTTKETKEPNIEKIREDNKEEAYDVRNILFYF